MATFRGRIDVPKEQWLRDMIEVQFERAFKRVKTNMMMEFWNHDVTKELDNRAGNAATRSNLSGTLSDYVPSRQGEQPNLYSFIGFEQPFDPINDSEIGLATILEKIDWVSTRWTRDGLIFNVRRPTADEIFDKTVNAKGTKYLGESWVKGIESGMAGLPFYLAFADKRSSSRSEHGLQAKNTKGNRVTPNAKFHKQKYISRIIKNFDKELSNMKVI